MSKLIFPLLICLYIIAPTSFGLLTFGKLISMPVLLLLIPWCKWCHYIIYIFVNAQHRTPSVCLSLASKYYLVPTWILRHLYEPCCADEYWEEMEGDPQYHRSDHLQLPCNFSFLRVLLIMGLLPLALLLIFSLFGVFQDDSRRERSGKQKSRYNV